MGGGNARKHRMIIFSQNSLIILFTFCTKFENGFQKFISNRYRFLGKAVFCVCARFPPMRLCVCVCVCLCVHSWNPPLLNGGRTFVTWGGGTKNFARKGG